VTIAQVIASLITAYTGIYLLFHTTGTTNSSGSLF
jgi:hypothetical protein